MLIGEQFEVFRPQQGQKRCKLLQVRPERERGKLSEVKEDWMGLRLHPELDVQLLVSKVTATARLQLVNEAPVQQHGRPTEKGLLALLRVRRQSL